MAHSPTPILQRSKARHVYLAREHPQQDELFDSIGEMWLYWYTLLFSTCSPQSTEEFDGSGDLLFNSTDANGISLFRFVSNFQKRLYLLSRKQVL